MASTSDEEGVRRSRDVAGRIGRRGRGRIGGPLVVVAVVVAAGVFVVCHDAGPEVADEARVERQESSPAPVHLVTVGWREGPQLSDPASGSRSPLGPSMSDDWRWCNTCPVVRVEDRAFTVQNRRLFSFTPGDSALRDLGPADLVFPTSDGEGLFVVREGVIEQRSLDNQVVGGPWSIPGDRHLTEQPHAISRGFVVSNKSEFIGDLAWWDTSTGRIHPLGAYNQFIDVHTDGGGHDTLAWTVCPTRDFPCSLVLSDLDGAERRVIDPPVAGNGFYLGGAFSPDGSTLATTVSMHPGTTDPDAALALVDVSSGEASVVAGSRFEVGEPYGYVTWSPDGTTVFFTGDNGVRSYDPVHRRVTDLPFPGSYYSVAAIPARQRLDE